ncbi:MAG: fibronectin type III-like domain-contianing protein, partial [Clostridia bacterium]|nr:fibronectin type III-like domain-contianing protein [Clostridia bacterium]
KKIVVVLFGGSPMLMPWLNEVNAVLNMYLGGQAVGEAAQELLYGIKNPCGKLAESYPQKLSDTPCFNYYANKKLSVELRESVFVGYRYYDTFETPTMFDFGYGLSYTTFDYSNLKITKNNLHNYTVEVTVKNTGKTAGKEIVQLYITAPNSDTMRPKRELKGFAKTDLLKPNESQKLEFHLDKRSFALYSPEKKDWVVGEGEYTVEISASLNNVKQSKMISVEGEKLPNQRKTLPAYFDQTGKTFTIPDDQFEELSGRKIIIDRNFTRGEFTTNSTLEQLQKYSLLAKIIVRISKKVAYKSVDGDINSPVYKMSTYGAMETPLHTLPAMTNNMVKMKIVRAVVDFANGKFFKGLGDLLGKDI